MTVQPETTQPDLAAVTEAGLAEVLRRLMDAMECKIDSDEGECPSCDTGYCRPHGRFFYCVEHDWHEEGNGAEVCGYALGLARAVLGLPLVGVSNGESGEGQGQGQAQGAGPTSDARAMPLDTLRGLIRMAALSVMSEVGDADPALATAIAAKASLSVTQHPHRG